MSSSKQVQRFIAFFLMVVVIGVTTTGCDLGSIFLDESKLDDVARYYYAVGKEKKLGGDKTYKFLSEKSRAQVSKEEWSEMVANDNVLAAKAVKVLGDRETGGKKYAIVSVEQMEKEGKYVYSDTWILENDKWRRLAFPKTIEEVDKASHAGDYAATKAKAEELLSMDPFSVYGHWRLGFALNRSDNQSYKRGDRSMGDIVRSLLTINPDDTHILAFAATFSDTPSIAKSYLKKLEGTSRYSNTAFNVILKINDLDARMEFFDRMEITPLLAILKLDTIGRLAGKEEFSRKYLFQQSKERSGARPVSWDDFRAVAASEGTFDKIKPRLDSEDAGNAALWAGRLGILFHFAKDDDNAQKWLDYGVTRDPNDPAVIKLAELLDHPKK